MASVNGVINKTVFNLNTKMPMQIDMNAINTAITNLQNYAINVENCGYPEKCQTTTCQSCQSTSCQSCQTSNCNCCSSCDDDGSNY